MFLKNVYFKWCEIVQIISLIVCLSNLLCPESIYWRLGVISYMSVSAYKFKVLEG